MTKKTMWIVLAVIAVLGTVWTLSRSGKAATDYETVAGDPMEARIYTLDNGLKVYMTVNKDEPRIQTYIAVRAGGKNDPADNTGLAHYLEHMMFKGSERFGTQDYEAEKPLLAQIDSLFEVYRTLTDPQERLDLYREIDAVSYEASKIAIPNEYDKLMALIGSEGSNAYTSNDVTCYVEEIPSNQLENWARIEADRFINCVFRGFHTELEAVYEEKNMSLTDDGEKALDALALMLFPSHPYGTQTVIGTQDHLKNPSLKAIRLQKDTYYVPNNVAICLSGDFDPEQTIGIIRKYFGEWKANPDLPVYEAAQQPELTAPLQEDVYGNDAEFVMLGWRTPGLNTRESEISDIVASVLYNGQAGLADLNILQSQKVLGGMVFPYNRTDYGLFLIEAMPKAGQSLEEAQQLFLAEVERLRNGDFPEQLVEAAKANWKLRDMQGLVSNRSRADRFVDAFVNGVSWEETVSRADRIAAVTKQDVVDWAGRYLGADSYAVVYKHIGEDPSVRKIDAPKITPIVTNRDRQSAFLREIAAAEPAPIEPVFVDFEKDLSVLDCNGLEFLCKKNEKNDIATLSFRYDRGSDDDPALSVASDYIRYLGTEQRSAEDIATALYGLACRFDLRVGGNTTVLSVSGLSENLVRALPVVEDLMAHAAADEDVLAQLRADLFRSRADAKMNQRACNAALRTYAMYGPDYVKARTLTGRQLEALSSEDLLGSLQQLFGTRPKILYYGPASAEEVRSLLGDRYDAARLTAVEKSHPQKRLTPEAAVLVAPYEARQFNYIQYSDRGETLDLSQDPAMELFNEYYGGGMNAIVFQEMRESRALAYSAGARLDDPKFPGDTYAFYASIASQNDKLRKAVEAFDLIIEELPQAPENLEIAKAAILGKLRTQRVTGQAVLYSYLQSEELGLSQPREKQVFEKVASLTMDDLLATHARWIKGRTYLYAILGDTQDLDMDFLRSLGPVKVVSLEEIFGY